MHVLSSIASAKTKQTPKANTNHVRSLLVQEVTNSRSDLGHVHFTPERGVITRKGIIPIRRVMPFGFICACYVGKIGMRHPQSECLNKVRANKCGKTQHHVIDDSTVKIDSSCDKLNVLSTISGDTGNLEINLLEWVVEDVPVDCSSGDNKKFERPWSKETIFKNCQCLSILLHYFSITNIVTIDMYINRLVTK